MRNALRKAAVVSVLAFGAVATPASASPDLGLISEGEILRVSVPEAFGGKTVIGQLTVANATSRGFVTAYACAEGLPRNGDGDITRSDLNYNGAVNPVASNRLVVQADAAGDVCFYTRRPVAMVFDVNAVSFDTGFTAFPNRRIDTREWTASKQILPAGGTLRLAVPEAVGRRVVVGQLTVDRAVDRGYVTAYACADGPPRSGGEIVKSDLNYNGRIAPAVSNRLMVRADDDGNVCFYTYGPVAMVVDINGVSDDGITPIAERRIDTRRRSPAEQRIAAGGVLTINVPEARGGRTVIGQLTIDRATQSGFVASYPCADGIPRNSGGEVARSDLNYNGTLTPAASNRLIVQADENGDICFYTKRAVSMIVDVSAVGSTAAINSFSNRRTDTRADTDPDAPTMPADSNVPQWDDFEPEAPLVGVAALTGVEVADEVAARPVLVAKVDNYRRARPQFDLDRADVVFDMNVEGVTRLVALFHSDVPETIGPLRSARTADLDLLPALNRPVFAYSGANDGVNAWVRSAESSGVLIDFSAQRRGCYSRAADRPGPHDLTLDTTCALEAASSSGSAQPLWAIDSEWVPSADMEPTDVFAFEVDMVGVDVAWAWNEELEQYERSQDGEPHLSTSGEQIDAANVVVIDAIHRPSVVDARSPHPETTGTGAGVLHRDGQAIEITWVRESPFDRFTLFHTVTGLPVFLDEGSTFVQVADL